MAAVQRLYNLKSRENKPGTLVAASIDQLVELGLKRRYLTAVEQFWPGAVSVIIPCSDPALAYLHQGKMSLAVRIPEDKKFLSILKDTGPLITSSANLPDQDPAETVEQAQNYFGDKVDYYQDGGSLKGRQPSTLIRIVDDAIEVLRSGTVEVDEGTGKIST
jgi:tRNA threonylcarbamoyl adenosine modification protein (Sua5/YciO/YrdC/YwlC family)